MYKRIAVLAEVVVGLHNDFGMDPYELSVLGLIIDEWNKGKQVNVTETMLNVAQGVASPATIHKIVTSLVNKNYIQYAEFARDRRVKYVVEGSRLAMLESALKTTGIKRALPVSEDNTQEELWT